MLFSPARRLKEELKDKDKKALEETESLNKLLEESDREKRRLAEAEREARTKSEEESEELRKRLEVQSSAESKILEDRVADLEEDKRRLIREKDSSEQRMARELSEKGRRLGELEGELRQLHRAKERLDQMNEELKTQLNSKLPPVISFNLQCMLSVIAGIFFSLRLTSSLA